MKIKNNHGFTLIEVIVAAGLLSALTFGVISQMQTMSKGQVTAETKMEELEIRRMVSSGLTDKLACQRTLVGKNIGDAITDINNAAGQSVYKVGEAYGNNTLKLASITTEDTGETFSDGTRSVNLLITFEKMKKTSLNLKTTKINMRVKAPSAAGLISECFADNDQVLQDSCVAAGGTWAGTKCEYPQYILKTGDVMEDGAEMAAGEFRGPLSGNVTGNLTGNVAGGTVAGSTATFSASLHGLKLCTGGDCHYVTDFALANVACNPGYVQVGVNATGAPVCKALQCPANQFFAGLSSSGTPVCRPFPNNTCVAGEYVAEVLANGKVTCKPLTGSSGAACPANEVMRAVSDGVPTCVAYTSNNTEGSLVYRNASGNFSAGVITADLVGNATSASKVAWTGITGRPTIPSGACATGQFIKEIKTDGTVTCMYPIAQTCPTRYAYSTTAAGSLIITGMCDPGCYVTAVRAQGGESSGCTATSRVNVNIDYIDYYNVGAVGSFNTTNFNFTIYGGTDYCRAAGNYCYATGTVRPNMRPQAVSVAFSAAHSLANYCVSNMLYLDCAPAY